MTQEGSIPSFSDIPFEPPPEALAEQGTGAEATPESPNQLDTTPNANEQRRQSYLRSLLEQEGLLADDDKDLDDKDLLRNLAHAYANAPRREQLQDYEDYVANRDQYQQWLTGQQSAPARQPEPEPELPAAPELPKHLRPLQWDDSWNNLLTRDQSGYFVPRDPNIVPVGVVQQANEYLREYHQRARKFFTDPVGYLQDYINQSVPKFNPDELTSTVESRLMAKLPQEITTFQESQRQQQELNQFFADHQANLVRVDEQGQPYYTASGQYYLTEVGQEYLQTVQEMEAKKFSPYEAHQYAYRLIAHKLGEVAPAEPRANSKAKPKPKPKPQSEPVPAGEADETNLLDLLAQEISTRPGGHSRDNSLTVDLATPANRLSDQVWEAAQRRAEAEARNGYL